MRSMEGITRAEIPDREIRRELLDLQSELESLIEEAEAGSANLSRNQFNWHPGAGIWSVAQCLDHLNVAHGKFLRSIRRALNDARPRVHPQQIRSTLFGKFYRWLLEPPVRQRLPAPKPFLPEIEEKELQPVLAEFRKTHRELSGEIKRMAEMEIDHVTLSSPISKYLRLNLYDAFRAIAAHGRRHLWQLKRIRSAAGFPTN